MESTSTDKNHDEQWDFLDAVTGRSEDEPVYPKKREIPVPQKTKRPERRHPMWRLGNTLEMWRAVNRMTQEQLGEKVGVSRRTISAIENRRHQPALSLALAIAEVFEVPVEKIFRLHRPTFSKLNRDV
jgi:putative transcriptional regulator